MPKGKRTLAVGAMAALLVALPLVEGDGVLAGLRGAGYAVCHQLPDHSLFVAGRQLPLCARCTGIYLGFLVGLFGLALLGKAGASRTPPGPVTALLLLSIMAMAADGLNSLLGTVSAGDQAYQPSNLLRLATGMAAGTALALLLVPMLNEALWATPDPSESVSDLGELAGHAVLAALATVVAYSDQPLLLYPLSIASVAGVFAALSAAGATLAATIMGREHRAACLRDASRVLAAGFALAVVSMATLGAARVYFYLQIGL